MNTTPFDFDVISGPSVPRDDRETDPRRDDAQPAAGAPPAQPQTR